MSALTDLNALQANIAESVLGQDQVIRQILLGLLANGHLLLESPRIGQDSHGEGAIQAS